MNKPTHSVAVASCLALLAGCAGALSSSDSFSNPEDAVRAIACPQSRLVAEMELPNKSSEQVESRLALMEAWIAQQEDIVSLRTTTWPGRAVVRMSTVPDADLEDLQTRFRSVAAGYELPFEIRETATQARSFMVIVHGNVDESTLQTEARRIRDGLPPPEFALGLFDPLMHLVVSSEGLDNFEVTRHEIAEQVRRGLEGRVVGPEELDKLEVIRGSGGFSVTVSDVARVTENRDAVTVVSFQGQPAVALGYAGNREELKEMKRLIQTTVKGLQKKTPVNVRVTLTPTIARQFCAPSHDRVPDMLGAYVSRVQVDDNNEEGIWRVFGDLDTFLEKLGAPALSVVGPVPAFFGDPARTKDITTVTFSKDKQVRKQLEDWFSAQPGTRARVSGGEPQLAVIVLGDDLRTLEEAAGRLGAGGEKWSTLESVDRLVPKVRDRAARRWRISESDILAELTAATEGLEVGVVGKRSIPVRLVSEESNGQKSIPEVVEALSYPSPRGKLVPFVQLIELSALRDQRIEHLDGRRMVVILWPVEDRRALDLVQTKVTDRYPSVEILVGEPPSAPKD